MIINGDPAKVIISLADDAPEQLVSRSPKSSRKFKTSTLFHHTRYPHKGELERLVPSLPSPLAKGASHEATRVRRALVAIRTKSATCRLFIMNLQWLKSRRSHVTGCYEISGGRRLLWRQVHSVTYLYHEKTLRL